MIQPLLLIENLSLRRQGRDILRGARLTMHTGQAHALLGLNGSGKLYALKEVGKKLGVTNKSQLTKSLISTGRLGIRGAALAALSAPLERPHCVERKEMCLTISSFPLIARL